MRSRHLRWISVSATSKSVCRSSKDDRKPLRCLLALRQVHLRLKNGKIVTSCLRRIKGFKKTFRRVIAYFRDKKDTDPTSVQARTHQAILKLCDELAVIVPKIISAKADD